MGYVQIDPLSVITRAHHHTLWTRRPDYDAEMLYELQAKDQRVFEYWGHALSYFPMSDYRYCLPRMRNFEEPKSKWANYLLEKYGHLMQPVLERIRKEGPLSPKDFARSPGTKRAAWGNEDATKAALDLLFWKGEIMITERRDLMKLYDLTERVLPKHIDTRMPDDNELGQFFLCRALSAYGVAQEREIRIFMQPETSRDLHIQAASKEVISKSLTDFVEAGEVIPVEIEDDKSANYYALLETIERSAKLEQMPAGILLLSPFENLIIHRERTKRLFGFDYALECYLPAAKRKYGYLVLPILWGETFVGRLDPKADRKKKVLIIRNLVFEHVFEAFDDFLPALADKLRDFAGFNQCAKIEFEKISPAKIRAPLERFVK